MSKTLIIAEAGVNHNGSIELAKQLIDIASDAGADIVKFQTFKSENLVSRNASKAEYQKINTRNEDSQLEMLKQLELKKEGHFELIEHCKLRKIQFLSSAFDLESVDFLHSLDLPFWKIPSGEITNLSYLEKIGSYRKKIILSSGMSTLKEIEEAIEILSQNGTSRENITVLHCNTEYPTPYTDVNLNAMVTIREKLNINVGYSDHTLGIEIPIAAVALGASVIEKHFTIDKNMVGPDHLASLEPNELKSMIVSIRNIEVSLGDGEKKPSVSESKNIAIARKSIVASCDISIGEKFSNENIAAKRPGNGISPMRWNEVIGKISKYNFKEDDLIEL